jgi:hypothetical protein
MLSIWGAFHSPNDQLQSLSSARLSLRYLDKQLHDCSLIVREPRITERRLSSLCWSKRQFKILFFIKILKTVRAYFSFSISRFKLRLIEIVKPKVLLVAKCVKMPHFWGYTFKVSKYCSTIPPIIFFLYLCKYLSITIGIPLSCNYWELKIHYNSTVSP